MKFIENLFRIFLNVKIRVKLIILVTGIVLFSVIPLSAIVLYRNQAVVLDKTFEVCRNLANNIANLATEELLINETFDSTRTSITRLKESNISGLLDSYLINIDGKYVAELNEKHLGRMADSNDLKYFATLSALDLKEIVSKENSKAILRFSYPIFIDYKKEKMRVGTAVFEFDKEKVYEPVVKIRTTIFGVGGVLVVIGALIALVLAIYMTKPIHKLSDGARIIGQGNLNHRIKLYGQDELGQLAAQFNQMTTQIQDFTQNLEDKVRQRTDELNQTLQQVHALKVQQDGDYYLTSLLLKPLQPNNNKSQFVKTDFYMEQKKKFEFRQWQSEIGGDICITDTIRLNNRDYTAFLNGDAMGKSIQGAGGALVLGVVFNAGLIRSRLQRNQKLFPEAWLKERFLDLHNVFLSFEGSMYISICLGLVDNETGLMYYINAEHPWTVLYRDGKASFLEEELALRKIGTPEQEERFFVRVFQLMPGDVIITGSDGRDDLLVKKQESDVESMNEDETEFLRRVEEGDGNLEKIAERIHEVGKIMDDFSVLRVSFKESQEEYEYLDVPYEVQETVSEGYSLIEAGKDSEALEKVENLFQDNPKFPDLLKLLARLYFNKGEIIKSIECLEQYLSINPGDNEYIYALSNAYRQIGKYTDAVDVGERLFLRDPNNFLNLVNLSASYLELKIHKRAEMMIGRALDRNPDDPVAVQLKFAIDRAKKELPDEEKEESQNTISREELEGMIKQADNYYAEKSYIHAQKLYERVLMTDEQNSYVLFRVANCCSLTGHLDEAVKFYNRALVLAPGNHHARNNLASTYYRIGKYEQAKEQWTRAIHLHPGFKTAEMNLSHLEKVMSEKTKAIA